MNLEEQLQILQDEAPKYGVPVHVMEKAVLPTLRLFASQLQHLKYYVFQNRDRAWIVATLSNKDNPQLEKKVIYAFADRKDAQTFQGIPDPQIRPTSIPSTHLLFQLFALKQVDSLILLETVGDISKRKEIQRQSLDNIIQQQLRRLKIQPGTIPPNFA